MNRWKIYGITVRGGAGLDGDVFGFDAGLQPFVRLLTSAGQVEILGSGFAEATSVTFNGAPASFHVVSDTYMSATIPRARPDL